MSLKQRFMTCDLVLCI